MQRRLLILSLLAFTGCLDTSLDVPVDPGDKPAKLGDAYDAGATGSIRGQVSWNDVVPTPEPKIARLNAFDMSFYKNPANFVMPHYPKVDATGRGVAGAVVFLRRVDAAKSRPWDHRPVRVEFRDRQLNVIQGDTPSDVGFVQRGASIDVVNFDSEYHNLRARGAALLGVPLLEPARVTRCALHKSGVVDMTCGAGYYWLHAHLFVSDHPYYTRTDETGRFELKDVPAGEYELVCWMPSWQVVRIERDPETGIETRSTWQPPQQQSRTVTVASHAASDADFRWAAAMFPSSRGP
jgi:hypothetical protein